MTAAAQGPREADGAVEGDPGQQGVRQLMFHRRPASVRRATQNAVPGRREGQRPEEEWKERLRRTQGPEQVEEGPSKRRQREEPEDRYGPFEQRQEAVDPSRHGFARTCEFDTPGTQS